jgi:predicted glycosyltransferase
MTPTAIAPSRLYQYGVAGKLVQYEGLKEEYYLTDAKLDPDGVRTSLGIPTTDILVVLRPPPSLALYHRGHTGDAFGRVVDRCLDQADTSVVLLPRIEEQAVAARELADQAVKDARPGRLIVPDHAVDALSLIAASDRVISAGGTMNREAVALGVPVATVFAGRMGGVDEALIADGRLTLVTNPDELSLDRRDRVGFTATLRDPGTLLELALEGVPVSS